MHCIEWNNGQEVSQSHVDPPPHIVEGRRQRQEQREREQRRSELANPSGRSKRFAALSAAIEDVADVVTDGQYKALYDAARMIFTAAGDP